MRITRENLVSHKYYKVYQELFKGKYREGLTDHERVLYGMIMYRTNLSLNKGWLNEKGEVFVELRRKSACWYLNVSPNSLKKYFENLKKNGLIDYERIYSQEADRIYPHNIEPQKITQMELDIEEEDKDKSEDNLLKEESNKKSSVFIDIEEQKKIDFYFDVITERSKIYIKEMSEEQGAAAPLMRVLRRVSTEAVVVLQNKPSVVTVSTANFLETIITKNNFSVLCKIFYDVMDRFDKNEVYNHDTYLMKSLYNGRLIDFT